MNYIMIAKIVLPVILAALIIGKRKFFRAIPISGYAYVMAWLLVGLTYGCLWISHYLLAFLGFNVHWEKRDKFDLETCRSIQMIRYITICMARINDKYKARFILRLINGN